MEDHGLSISPQALASLAETILRSPTSIVGDTDSLLLGLLYSGSYTVDVLEAASANPSVLRRTVANNLQSIHSEDQPVELDPVRALFQECAFRRMVAHVDHPIETADILRAALSPWHQGSRETETARQGASVMSLRDELHAAMDDMLIDLVSQLNPDSDGRRLRAVLRRVRPLTADEKLIFFGRLRAHDPDITSEELDFAAQVLNAWFTERRVMIEPSDLAMQLIDRVGYLTFGARLFAESGGDLSALDSCLALTAKFNPERDLNGFALFQRDNRIHLGQYTYRNTFAVDTRIRRGLSHRHLAIQALRPVSLIPADAIAEFEELVSDQNVKELQIQSFLVRRPEFLEAMGYTRAHPHVCLHEDGKDDLIPDFLLELPGGRGFDILDLKLPFARMVSRYPRLRLSSEIAKAVAQLREYSQFFECAENRKRFELEFGLEAFKPELIVVLGRVSALAGRDERVELEGQMSGVKLVTYDDILAYGNTRTIELPKSSLGLEYDL
jgi:hypothetical protein